MWCTHFPPGSQAAKAATAVAPRKEPRSEPVVNLLPVGRIDLKKAEAERKAAEEPDKIQRNWGGFKPSHPMTDTGGTGIYFTNMNGWFIRWMYVNICKYTIYGWYGNCFCWEDTVTDDHHWCQRGYYEKNVNCIGVAKILVETFCDLTVLSCFDVFCFCWCHGMSCHGEFLFHGCCGSHRKPPERNLERKQRLLLHQWIPKFSSWKSCAKHKAPRMDEFYGGVFATSISSWWSVVVGE